MYPTDSPSQRTREGGAAGAASSLDADIAARFLSDRTRPPETVDRPVVDTGNGVARIVREYPVGSLARRSTASGPAGRGGRGGPAARRGSGGPRQLAAALRAERQMVGVFVRAVAAGTHRGG